MPLNDRDISELSARSIDQGVAERQLQLLRSGAAHAPVLRPCTLGDGILILDEEDRQTLAATFRAASKRIRLARFVPASGAATRMFAHLRGQGDDPARHTFFAMLRQLPFAKVLNQRLEALGQSLERCLAEGDYATVTSVLLDEAHMGFDQLPKGSIPFHGYGDSVRTAFQEQLVEAAGMMASGTEQEVHFTVPSTFSDEAQHALIAYGRALNAKLSVSFSVQSPQSDTLALDSTNEPLRNDENALVLRPGGHGALLHNLALLHRDVVFIKNIDNIVPEPHQPWVNYHKSVLGGLLLSLVAERNALLHELQKGALPEAAEGFLRRWFFGDGWDGSPSTEEAIALLDRPVRVCGMVRNTGEPGGGPFWMNTGNGVPSVQIIESSQIDRNNPEQEALLKASTHFNPVDMVCALNDADGNPYNLVDFANPNRVIVTQKVHNGRGIRVLELPGLWNGGMENWLSVFAEVPADTFAPVKTVNDLLRPAHQL